MSKNFSLVFVWLAVCALVVSAQSEQVLGNQTALKQTASNRLAADETTSDESANARQTTDDELQRFEIGAQFSSLNRNFDNRNGFGARFTYNFNRYVAAEAEANFYPGENFDGRAAQFVAGAKIGKRFSKFGFFGKARPGFLYTSQGNLEFIPTNANTYIVRRSSRTEFALDVGGVVEFYPTKNLVTRFDAGDTIVRSPGRNIRIFDNSGNIVDFRTSGSARHYFQFTAGIGFRF